MNPVAETTRSGAARPAAADAAQRAASPPAEAGFSWPQVQVTMETMLTALILAFVFRAFLVEAFIIPTGSMAPGLHGAHLTRVCDNCGWESDCGPARGSADAAGRFEWPPYVLCPNCQMRLDDPARTQPAPKPGDRILVHKWPFDLGGPFAPRRWDVVVFRDPADPALNYIKRVVGLPGESVEIIDGDVYIAAVDEHAPRIARKTAAAQSQLWMIVFDQDHPPRAAAGLGVRPCWAADPIRGSRPGWTGLDGRVFRFRAADGEAQTIRFAPQGPHAYVQDVYAYNHGASGALVGDVRLVGELVIRAGEGSVELHIERDGVDFAACIRRDGKARLTMFDPQRDAAPVELGRAALGRLRFDWPIGFEFAHLDCRVSLRLNGREVLATGDAQYAPDIERLRARPPRTRPVELAITAAGVELELRRVRIERDVHYTYRGGATRRAGPGDAFVLLEDEYFVLGDNSPESHDSREWHTAGSHLPDDYRIGTVRADQIVGRAFLVYLPGLLPVDSGGWWRMFDLGRVRFIR